MDDLSNIDLELADFLIDNVINKRGILTYKEVAEELSKRLHRNINAHYNLAVPLYNVSTLCFKLGLPLISARVIFTGATDSHAVGAGFHQFACKFRPEYKTMDPVAAWKHELQLIRDCLNWHSLREFLDGKPLELIGNAKEALKISDDSITVTFKQDETAPSLAPQTLMSDLIFPDEINAVKEGALKIVNVNIHERNPAAREKCIAYYGTACAVCNVDLGNIFGEEFSGKIHVHHLVPISEYDEEHDIDPVNDLRPICPNCHMIIHCGKDKPYTIDEVKSFIDRTNRKPNY